MGIFSVLFANDLREDRYGTRARRQARQRSRDEQVAQATVRRQMSPYLSAGVITQADMEGTMAATESRLRKVWAYDGAAWACGGSRRRHAPGLPQEEIERRIAEWRRNWLRVRG